MPTRRPAPDQEALFRPPPGRQPLAARMRPRTLDEFVGQDHLVGEHGPLRRSLERGYLGSILLWGPPGTGKTTLARILADAVDARFLTLSAVMSGVADIRAAVTSARERLVMNGGRTILFIDEIHRFNKAQQDALLPHVEDGTVTLVGATTENPYAEVNSALLSRLRVWRLEPLPEEAVGTVVRRALADADRGLAGAFGPAAGIDLPAEAFDHLVELAGGDARQALNVLEGAVTLAEAARDRDGATRERNAAAGGGGESSVDGPVRPTLADVEAAAQQRVLAYDRAGDGHFDTVSAFIKSIRGNDPDAALYWLATMIAAGEDPRFIARRLIVSASEDVGNADPRGLQVAVAAAQALDWVGLPEAQYALAQATALLSVLPHSDSVGRAYAAAMADVLRLGTLPVPLHLRNATDRRLRQHGIGVGYQSPHDFEGDDLSQQYLPDALVGQRYYVPSDQGQEVHLAERMAAREQARREPPRRKRIRAGADPMAVFGEAMKHHAAARSSIAEKQRSEATDSPADDEASS